MSNIVKSVIILLITFLCSCKEDLGTVENEQIIIKNCSNGMCDIIDIKGNHYQISKSNLKYLINKK